MKTQFSDKCASRISEAQQTTLDEVSKALHEACSELQNRKRELEMLENFEETLTLIRTRIDLLEVIEARLLAPLKNEYAFIERTSGNQHPWEVYALKDRRRFVFLDSIMKGL